MKRFIVVIALLVLLAAPAEPGELTPEQNKQAETLIKQLADRAFAARQQAVEKLIALGPDVVPLVQKTLAETNDYEVRLRCRMVLKRIAGKHGIVIPGITAPTSAEKFGLDASTITLKVRGTLGEVLDELAAKSGNRLVKAPDAWDGAPVALDVTDMPYWRVLDEICTQTGFSFDANYPDGTLFLVKVDRKPTIIAYAGPVIVRLNLAEKRKTYHDIDQTSANDSLTYALSYYWEDRIDALYITGRVTKATLADGTMLKLIVGSTYNPGTRSYNARLRPSKFMRAIIVGDLPRASERIAEMEGVISFVTGTGKRELRVENALTAQAMGAVGNTSLQITRIESDQQGALLRVTVTMTARGDDRAILAFRDGSEYGFVLIDPKGGRHAGRTDGWFTRPIGRATPEARPDRAVVNDNPKNGQEDANAEDPATTTIWFGKLPDIEGKWTLVATIPAKTAVKEFTFRLKNVPIP